MFKKIFFAVVFVVTASASLNAQLYESNVQEGEFGVSLGLGHYFGDLNTRAALNRPKFAGGVFFRKQFTNYIGLKLSANYVRLGYSDKYSSNETQKLRNLSFNSNVWEFALSGDFNFFKFYPGVEGYNYTPYVSLGLGVFSYDPFAYLNGQKYYLRSLGTEGQGSTAYPDRKQYGTMAVCFPLSFGFKYSLNESMNLFAEVSYRFTTTDYLDDVSTTYAGADAFTNPSTGTIYLPDGSINPAYLLQDRSYEVTTTPIGVKNRQRGNSQQKDAYATFQVGVSFNITSYRCPTAN